MALLLSLTTTAGASHDGPLAGQWHLDTNAGDATPDSSGHGFNGAATDVALDPGRFGDAMTFPVATAGVVVPNNALLEPPQPTLVAWVHRDGPPGAYQYVAGKGGSACTGGSYALYS